MKKKIHLILGIVQVFVAIGALPAGYSMMADPSGQGLKMSTEMLANSPFSNFLIPGIFLFTVNGVLNLVAAVVTFLKKRNAWLPGLGLGFAMLIWISIQVLSIGYVSVLQPIYFGIGILEIALSLWWWRDIKEKKN